ncbi:MAG: hypothetical protein NT133_24670 [Alphaproteobacteria bacterium]|nr:hypothetical protein [Alphaproteobacteria bacterium]
MRTYTAHLKANATPVLVPEGFSIAAAQFGPFWLLAQRAWIAGVLALCAWAGIALLDPPGMAIAAAVLAWAQGVFGRDLLRWSLTRRGYQMEHVLAARDEDGALARLLAARPDLATGQI